MECIHHARQKGDPDEGLEELKISDGNIITGLPRRNDRDNLL